MCVDIHCAVVCASMREWMINEHRREDVCVSAVMHALEQQHTGIVGKDRWLSSRLPWPMCALVYQSQKEKNIMCTTYRHWAAGSGQRAAIPFTPCHGFQFLLKKKITHTTSLVVEIQETSENPTQPSLFTKCKLLLLCCVLCAITPTAERLSK